MKRYIYASYMNGDLVFNAEKKIGGAVEDIINDIYSSVNLSEDDPRADYFVANILTDDEVTDAMQDLVEAIKRSTDRQMMRR